MSVENKIRLSVLDLSPIPSGASSSEALRNTLDLARFTDVLGFARYWLAEHHNTALLASSAPEIMIGQVAAVTERIHVGSGGVMLPNHAPLKVAENFKVLEALFPGRIELGLGRAPGTDQTTALALRRSRQALGADDFPQQLAELLGFFSGDLPPGHPFHRVEAIPTDVTPPPIWLLGSSDYSSYLAAQMGLGFAFAHHISPEPAIQAMRLYLDRFQPSQYLQSPEALMAVSVICAETDEAAEELASSADLTLLRFYQNRRQSLPSVQEALAYDYTEAERAVVDSNRARMFVGSPSTIRTQLGALVVASGVSEIMITSMIHDHAARLRSYELLAKVFAL